VGGEARHLSHHRGEPCDRPDAQVVPVGEATGHDHGVGALEVRVGVPQDLRVRPATRLAASSRVDVVAGAGEADDAELHVLWIS